MAAAGQIDQSALSVAPTRLRDAIDRRAGSATVSFDLRGRTFRRTFEQPDDFVADGLTIS